jgi:hypothetical protein
VSSTRRWSTARVLGSFLGAFLLFALAFQVVETLAPPAEIPEADFDVLMGGGGAAEPIHPVVRKLGDDSVSIEVGDYHHSTITVQSEAFDADALVTCISESLERALEDGSLVVPDARTLRSLTRHAETVRMREQLSRIQEPCLLGQLSDAPLAEPGIQNQPPSPPEP